MKTVFLLFFFLFLETPYHARNSNNSIFEAVIRNNTKSVEYMIKKGADPTVTDKNGMSLLHFVSDPSLALILLINGVDVNSSNRSGSTPLHWVVSQNREDIAKLLIAFGADINRKDNKGNTPLHYAISSTDKILLLLIKSNADVNIRNKEGNTPLVSALLQNNTNSFRYLILAGAENIKNNTGISPSILATIEKSPEIKLGLTSTALDPIIREIFVENYLAATTLINENTPIDNVDIYGNTALHWAFEKKNRDLTQLLLEKGADYSAFNYNDLNPIDVLLKTEDKDFIQYVQDLLKDKTNFYSTNEIEKTITILDNKDVENAKKTIK